MSKQRLKKIKKYSSEWFSNELGDPDLASLVSDIRSICVLADNLHRTVSGTTADRIKSEVLYELGKEIARRKNKNIKASRSDLKKIIGKANADLLQMDKTPAQNPSDWKVKTKVAEARSKNRLFCGKRGLQGGAPQ